MELPKHQKNNKTSPLKTPSKKQKLLVLNETELSKHYSELLLKESLLEKDIAALTAKGLNTDLNAEMNALHKYNDMKDLAQMVLGYLADAEQTTIAELHRRYNLPTD